MHISFAIVFAGCLFDNVKFISREMSIGKMRYILMMLYYKTIMKLEINIE